jgi:hypothetical protein
MTFAAQFREALIRSSGREAPEPRLCMHDPWVTCMHDRRRVTARGVVKTPVGSACAGGLEAIT